jgi:hypothetical protein
MKIENMSEVFSMCVKQKKSIDVRKFRLKFQGLLCANFMRTGEALPKVIGILEIIHLV